MTASSSDVFTRTDRHSLSILIVDDDPLMLTAMGSVLNMQGFRCVLARSESVAMQAIGEASQPKSSSQPARGPKSERRPPAARGIQFDLLVLSIDDLQTGCEFASRLRAPETMQDVPIIFLVPELSATWTSQLGAQGGVFSMLKPIQPEGLIELVEKAVWMPHLARNRTGQSGTHLQRQSDWISLAED